LQKYDAVIGDITIRYNRTLYADFTPPYTESGISMIVPVKENINKNAWIFLKPLTFNLWLGSFGFFVYTGVVIWVMEHRINTEFRGPLSHQLGTIFYFSFSTLVFAHSYVLSFTAEFFLYMPD
jgi:glutamate receptor, ionotropic, plant